MWKCTPIRAAAAACMVAAALSTVGALRSVPATAAVACDLTGQWRSTIGVLDLIYAPYRAAMSAGGLVRPTVGTEGPAPEPVTADGARQRHVSDGVGPRAPRRPRR